MDIQVQELIDKIKKDGIETASSESQKIKAQAETEAAHIIDSAKKEADDILAKAKQDAERFEKAGVAALQQASRNLVLAFKEEIQALLNSIILRQVSSDYNDDALKAALPEILKTWAVKGDNTLSVLVNEADLEKIRGFFNEKLNSELSRGVELKSSRKLKSGFHISSKEGSVYYDFSAEAVASLLSAYLNPKLAEILNTSSKGL
jgi:V/A-type H+-transporting ATPase subunit E